MDETPWESGQNQDDDERTLWWRRPHRNPSWRREHEASHKRMQQRNRLLHWVPWLGQQRRPRWIHPPQEHVPLEQRIRHEEIYMRKAIRKIQDTGLLMDEPIMYKPCESIVQATMWLRSWIVIQCRNKEDGRLLSKSVAMVYNRRCARKRGEHRHMQVISKRVAEEHVTNTRIHDPQQNRTIQLQKWPQTMWWVLHWWHNPGQLWRAN